jgi:acyl-CoA-binding protein
MFCRDSIKLCSRPSVRSVLSQRRWVSDDLFASAVNAVSSLTKEPPQNTKLDMYALYKQATQGNCIPSEKPSAFNFVASAKYGAWEKLKDMQQDTAKELYVKKIEELLGHSIAKSSFANTASTNKGASTAEVKKSVTLKEVAYPVDSAEEGFKSNVIDLQISQKGVATALLNRPAKLNAFNMEMWAALRDCFSAINRTPAARVVVLTGGPKSFSTGMDLSVFASMESLSSKESCEGRKREAVGNIIQYLQDAISAPENCRVPVVCGIMIFSTNI